MSDLTRRRIVVGFALAAAVLCFAPLDAVGLRPSGAVQGVALVYESSQGVPGAFLAADVESLLKAKQVEYRRADKDATFADDAAKAKWQPYIAAAGANVPSVVINRGGKYSATKVGDDTQQVLTVLRKAVGQ